MTSCDISAVYAALFIMDPQTHTHTQSTGGEGTWQYRPSTVIQQSLRPQEVVQPRTTWSTRCQCLPTDWDQTRSRHAYLSCWAPQLKNKSPSCLWCLLMTQRHSGVFTKLPLLCVCVCDENAGQKTFTLCEANNKRAWSIRSIAGNKLLSWSSFSPMCVYERNNIKPLIL